MAQSLAQVCVHSFRNSSYAPYCPRYDYDDFERVGPIHSPIHCGIIRQLLGMFHRRV